MSLQSDLNELERRHREDGLSYFEPYDWQRLFMCARDAYGEIAEQTLLRAANQVGKTFCGGRAVAIHATGLYPNWYDGKRFDYAPLIWVGGNTIPNTRDLCQAELLGEPGDLDSFGTAAIPKHLIGRVTKYHGIPDALQSVLVRHVSGKWTKIVFKAYEQGKDAWMGKGVDYVWGDEEMPYDIYSQCLRATLRKSGIIGLTATPEKGMTQLMRMFSEDCGKRQAMVTATWDEAPHLDDETKAQRLASLLPFEREMRSKGIPSLGSGLIWPISEGSIRCDPFVIPDDWPRIGGIDFAGSGTSGHPSALVAIAIDPQSGKAYLYDGYRKAGLSIPQHWLNMKRVGDIPIAWPHDGMIQDRGSGVSYSEQYRQQGANMLFHKFSNPPAPGMPEGSGGNGVKAGLTEMYAAMEQGLFKVFSNIPEWFEEFRYYYQKDSVIVKEKDDLMSATRYAYMSKRFAVLSSLADEDGFDGEYEDYTGKNAVCGY